MTKKCIAARKRYRARKAGVPTGTRKVVRRKRATGTRRRGHGKPSHYPRRRGSGFGDLYKQLKKNQPSKPKRKPRMARPSKMRGAGWMKDYGLDNPILASLNSKMVAGVGAGFRKKRRKVKGRGRGRVARFPKGAGFWDDVGQTLINVGQTALQVLPLML